MVGFFFALPFRYYFIFCSFMVYPYYDGRKKQVYLYEQILYMFIFSSFLFTEVWVSVSATTRAPRPGEVDGVNYWFLTEDEFLAREAAGEFLETAVVHGMAHYGTLLKPVEEHLAAGVPTILEIDLQGARRVKQRAAELDLEVVYVFIAPPSFEELERRLIGRGTETAEQQARRLETAKVELAAESEFDVTIVNETVDQAAADLWSVIAKEYGL